MDRRAFIKALPLSLTGMIALISVGGCAAPLVSSRVRESASGAPWRCQNCGHLTRSDEDLANVRCPRCGRRMLTPITEEEMQQRLKVVKAREGA